MNIARILLLKKREKFVLSSFVVSLSFFVHQLVVPSGLRQNQWHLPGMFTVVALIWSLWGSWEGFKIILVAILPVMFTIGMVFIAALPPIPNSLVAMGLLSIVFGFSFYSLLLIANIYTVSAIRTIPLIRAAHTIGFLFTLVTVLLLFHTIFSFHLSFSLNVAFAFLIMLLLSLQSLWAITLQDSLSSEIIIRSVVCAYILAQIAAVLSFWPANSAMKALFVTSAAYTVLGILHHEVQERARFRYVIEYILFGIVALSTLALTTSWRG